MNLTATAGKNEKGDAQVTVLRNESDGDEITFKSPVRSLFSRQQDEAVAAALREIGVRGVSIEVEDNHALDFVIAARIKAAVYRLLEAEV